tara:strand:+ start:543 stop:1505 length:963 start_codon:yes stop_codon:yes gene_type:complete
MKNYNNLESLLKEERPNVRQITINSYISYLQNLHLRLTKNREFENLEWLEDFDLIHSKIEFMTYLSQRNICNAIVVALKAVNADIELIEKYADICSSFNQEYHDNIRSQDYVNKKQEKNMPTKKELDDVIDELDKYIRVFKYKTLNNLDIKNYLELQMLVILRFHQLYPLRNDLVTVQYMKKSEYKKIDGKKPNVFLWDKSELILNEHKTSHALGTNAFTVSKPIASLLRTLIKQQISAGFENDDNYLLIKRNGKSYSKVEFSNLLIDFFKKKLKKNISTTILRKVYLSKYTTVKKEQNDDAKMMMHSTETQQNIYIPKS